MIKFLDLTPQPELSAELDAAYNRVMTAGATLAVLSLPIGSHLGEADIMRVIEAIKELEG